ncbi:ABC transporter ATP-binding protein [Brevibacterium permense]|uniref:ABC transporter ATP-binding protein n=1 Tax=Brevibacterium permense TaxID=234834 RepID=UPI0021CFA269|nr:ABC transporter ATP-binding protein [Brevibacterium permense]
MSESSGAAISLRGVERMFGEVAAVAGVDLEIAEGEFFSMLGPSGSGKTTVLRLIAGFDEPTAGAIELAGKPVQHLASYDRDVNTVFQDYALFPHLNVIENVEFGLRVRRIPKARRRQLAREALERMRLASFENRRPGELSGGQRQRVALARAIVVDPKVLLLDEPLGALDKKLREQMQIELKDLQRNLGITFVFVTHDQEEALTLSDRIAVFSDGQIQQVDTPENLYSAPATEFVASFVGTSNLFDEQAALRHLGLTGRYTIRPENLRFVATDSAEPGRLSGTVRNRMFIGASHRTIVEVDDLEISVLEPAGSPNREIGEAVAIDFNDSDVRKLRTTESIAA